MCLAFPGKIIEIKKDTATIDYNTEKRKAKIIEKKYSIGDYVIAQAGFVIQKIPEKQALDSIKLMSSAIR